MPHNYDPLDPAYPPPEAAPSGGPPQFNESCCGYRCGWGCCEPSEADGESDGDGDGDDRRSERSSGSTTVVGDEEQNQRMERVLVRMNFVVMGTPRPQGLPILGEIERGTGLVILTNANGFDRVVISAQDSPYVRSPRLGAYHDLDDSLMPNPSSGYMTATTRSRGIPSPRTPGFGIGDWQNGGERGHALFPDYHFREPPLRLSSQDGQTGGQNDTLVDAADIESLRNFLEHMRLLQAARTDSFL